MFRVNIIPTCRDLRELMSHFLGPEDLAKCRFLKSSSGLGIDLIVVLKDQYAKIR